MHWTLEDIQEAFEKVSARAATDVEFRNLCLKNPEAAVEVVMDKPLPKGYKIKFIENDQADATFVLPDLQEDEVELNETDLEQVAGGAKCGVTCGGTGVGVGCGGTVCGISCGASCIGSCLCVSLPTVTGA